MNELIQLELDRKEWLIVSLVKLVEALMKEKSCSIPCSPSDWYKGGKCDINGCYYE